MNKKKQYAVYKYIDKSSHYFGAMYYTTASEGLKVGDTIGTVECVLISDDEELIHKIINKVPDEVGYNIA